MKRAARRQLPLIIIDDRSALPGALHMLATGKAYGAVYIDDWAGRPGQMFARTFLAPGHEHRQAELEALVRRSVESSGCAIVDADELARLGRRGAA